MCLYLVPEWIPIPNNVTQFTVIVVLASIVLLAVTKRVNFILRVNKIPGLFCGLTILGNAPMLPISSEGKYHFVFCYLCTTFLNLPCICNCRYIYSYFGLRARLAIMRFCSSYVGWTISSFFPLYT